MHTLGPVATKWWTYVKSVTDDNQVEIGRKSGVGGPTVNRWANGKTKADAPTAARFARAYGRPVTEALIAIDLMSAEEAGATEVMIPKDLDAMDSAELATKVQRIVDVLRSRAER